MTIYDQFVIMGANFVFWEYIRAVKVILGDYSEKTPKIVIQTHEAQGWRGGGLRLEVAFDMGVKLRLERVKPPKKIGK